MKTGFYERCYKILRKVPKGKVTTYKVIAHALHSKAYRAVGTAMNKNTHAPQVPCHRVVNSDGRIGGFAHGTKKKKTILEKEGVIIVNGKINLKKFLYKL